MKFGGMVATNIGDWQIFQELETLGYDHGWAPDSQMIWSDCYATLALSAHHTSRIRLGTGVAIAGTRTAPVTAHSIASINKLAPGRTFLVPLSINWHQDARSWVSAPAIPPCGLWAGGQ